MSTFPGIPPQVLEEVPAFVADPGLRDWAVATFVDPKGALFNPDHIHLLDADLLFVWSGVTFRSQGRTVVGTAQRGRQQGSNGKRELLEWIYASMAGGGHRQDADDTHGLEAHATTDGAVLPDFVITLCAPFFALAGPRAFCAVVEHELYHCGQAEKRGMPLFNQLGVPIWCMRGHDVEEFTGVVGRYGAHSEELERFRQALNDPEIPFGEWDVDGSGREWTGRTAGGEALRGRPDELPCCGCGSILRFE